jgi:hypothetical protein
MLIVTDAKLMEIRRFEFIHQVVGNRVCFEPTR